MQQYPREKEEGSVQTGLLEKRYPTIPVCFPLLELTPLAILGHVTAQLSILHPLAKSAKCYEEGA